MHAEVLAEGFAQAGKRELGKMGQPQILHIIDTGYMKIEW